MLINAIARWKRRCPCAQGKDAAHCPGALQKVNQSLKKNPNKLQITINYKLDNLKEYVFLIL